MASAIDLGSLPDVFGLFPDQLHASSSKNGAAVYKASVSNSCKNSRSTSSKSAKVYSASYPPPYQNVENLAKPITIARLSSTSSSSQSLYSTSTLAPSSTKHASVQSLATTLRLDSSLNLIISEIFTTSNSVSMHPTTSSSTIISPTRTRTSNTQSEAVISNSISDTSYGKYSSTAQTRTGAANSLLRRTRTTTQSLSTFKTVNRTQDRWSEATALIYISKATASMQSSFRYPQLKTLLFIANDDKTPLKTYSSTATSRRPSSTPTGGVNFYVPRDSGVLIVNTQRCADVCPIGRRLRHCFCFNYEIPFLSKSSSYLPYECLVCLNAQVTLHASNHYEVGNDIRETQDLINAIWEISREAGIAP